MKRFILIVLCMFVAVSCTKQEFVPEPELNHRDTGGRGDLPASPKKLDDFTDFSKTGYQGQLSYVFLDSSNGLFIQSTDADISAKIVDPTVTWKYFDSLYNSTLPDEQKQCLAFIILARKDLIGLLQANPENLNYREAVMKYINILTDTQYLGYCLLYSALQTIDDDYYVKSKSGEIIAYSATEVFHTLFLNSHDNGGIHFQKVEEDYEYLQQIRELQEN